jgi:hypothetical protein
MSQSPRAAADAQIEDIQARIREQKALLQRKIAQGTIAQADDDVLRQMYVMLKSMQAARLTGSS